MKIKSALTTAVIWKTIMAAQKRFRRLKAPGLLAKVYAGVRYEDGGRRKYWRVGQNGANPK